MNIDRNGRAHPPLPVARSPGDVPPAPNPESAIAGALARPLGAPALERFVEPGDRVAVLQDAGLSPDLRALAAAPIAEALGAAGAAEVRWLVVEAAPPTPGADAGAETAESAASGFVAVGRAPRIGVVRLLAEVAKADKLVLVGRCGWDPRLGPVGAGSLVAWGSAGSSSRAAILDLGSEPAGRAAIEGVLLLAPPAFALQLGLQSGARLAGVFAGDCLAVSDTCARSLRRG